MKDKNRITEQINIIKNSLMESERFMPYDYKMLIMWGIISIVLFLSLENIVKYGLGYTIGFMVIIIGIGFLYEIFW